MTRHAGVLRILALFLALAPAAASARPEQNQLFWTGVTSNLRLSPQWALTGELQLRSFDNWDGVRALELRPGVSYALSPTLTLAGGVGYIRNHDRQSDDSTESRLWTQLVASSSLPGVRLTNRLRFEERFIELPGQPDVDGLRLRYQLRAQVSLASELPLLHDSYVIAMNELSLNLIHRDQLNGHRVDQNRTAAGLGHRVSRALDVEMTYLHVYVVGRTQDSRNHVLQLSFATRF